MILSSALSGLIYIRVVGLRVYTHCSMIIFETGVKTSVFFEQGVRRHFLWMPMSVEAGTDEYNFSLTA